MHPGIEGVAENLTRPNRIPLTELLVAGLLAVELIDLADAEEAKLGDRRFVTRVRVRWRSASNPLARAARAAGAHLQVLGVDLATVALMPRSVLDEQQNRWAVTVARRICAASSSTSATSASPTACSSCTPSASARCAPSTHRPNPAALLTGDIEGWLSQRAPQIHRIG